MGTASPSNSLSSPAMMRREARLRPSHSIPARLILAPGKERERNILENDAFGRHDLAHAIHRINVLSHGSRVKPVVVRAAIIAGWARRTRSREERPRAAVNRAGGRGLGAADPCGVLLGGSGDGDDGRACRRGQGLQPRGVAWPRRAPRQRCLSASYLAVITAASPLFWAMSSALARELGVDAFKLAVEHRNHRLALSTLTFFASTSTLRLLSCLAERLATTG